jgi:RNA polymerase sigma-70 factor (ECF subfamily)
MRAIVAVESRRTRNEYAGTAMPGREPTEFERVCLPFLPECHAFALALTRNLPDADDLVQETFLKAQRSFDSFQRGTNAKAWLFTALRRLHIDRYRRARVRPATLAEEALDESPLAPAAAAPPEAEDWASIPPEAVREAVSRVPDPFRLAVVLRDLEGLSYAEIGAILEVPPGTVMSRLHRGREYVRQALVSHWKGRPRP